jgi:hypothetical protein
MAKVRQLPDQAGDVPYTCASVEKARALLGYEATVSFDEGIRRTVEWYNDRSSIVNRSSDGVVALTTSTEKGPVEIVVSEKPHFVSLELTRKTHFVKSEAEITQGAMSGLSRVVSVDLMSQHRASKRMKT